MPHVNAIFPELSFDWLRDWRKAHYAGWSSAALSSRTRAIITCVRDEAILFPIWLGYYSKFFSPADIFVLDHETRDGSTSGTGFNRIPLTHPSFDTEWMLERVTEMQHELIQHYDVVMVCDVDEIVAPDPTGPIENLGQYLDRFDEKFVSCVGYEVLHRADREPPIDMARPLLSQRGSWFRNALYDKPIIASVPMSWVPGLHRRTDGLNNYDPDLRMIHLHRLDLEQCFARHVERASYQIGRRDLEQGRSSHYQITERSEFERWFFESTGLATQPLVLEPIEPRWHSVV